MNIRDNILSILYLFVLVGALSSCIQNPAAPSKGSGLSPTPAASPSPNNSTANSTGTGDGTSVVTFSLNGAVRAIIQYSQYSENDFLVGGDFTSPPHLAKLDISGNLDASFNSNLGQGPNSSVLALVL